MRSIKSINSSEMSKSTETLANLGGVFYGWDVFRGEYNGIVVLNARIHYSWTGMTGGGALYCRATALPTSAAATSEANYLFAGGPQAYSTQWSNTHISPTLLGGGAASGSSYFDTCMFTYSDARGYYVPMPPYWTLRLSNGSTAFTGGTLTINKVEFFG